MKDQHLEALEAVIDINCDLTTIYGMNNATMVLELVTNGFCTVIKFLDQVLWNSEDDDRHFDDEVGYEPIKNFLIKQVKELPTKLQKLSNLH